MKTYSRAIAFVLVGLLSISSIAAENCSTYFQDLPSGNYLKKVNSIPDDIKVGGKPLQENISKIVEKYTGKKFTKKTFESAIDEVAETIAKRTDLDDLAKGQEMAKFGKELNPSFEAMIKKYPRKGTVSNPDLKAWILRQEAIDQVKNVKFGIVRKISQFENFKVDEFIKVDKNSFVMTIGNRQKELTHMPLEEYPDYVDSLLHYIKDPESPKAKLYNDIDEGDLGVLDIGDIRDITSYNLWPMYLKRHDMRHIHYGLSHPMALATMFSTTRSKNNLRYVMMGGLYEGVDRIQYSHEIALNDFFGKQIKSEEAFGIKRNLDLEEAMLMLGMATDDDLAKIAQASNAQSSMSSFVSDLNGWKPKIVKGTNLQGKALNGLDFDADIDKMVNDFREKVKKSERMKRKLFDDGSIELSAEEEQFMKMMNYQLDPESPEIVIDGIRYKNDGRAHSRDWSGNTQNGDAPIGIGDQ